METIRSIAKAYYDSVPKDVQMDADNFYESMMSECSGTIGESQFLKFTEKQYPLLSYHGFFQMLKENKNKETLSRNDVMTMYYIIMSGRPFCKFCGHFFPEVYFTCFDCFHKTGSADYKICLDCFKNKVYINHKCKHYRFIDCYSWLYAVQKQNSSAMGSQLRQPQPSGAMPSQARHENNAVNMLGLVNAGLTTANLVLGLCSIL